VQRDDARAPVDGARDGRVAEAASEPAGQRRDRGAGVVEENGKGPVELVDVIQVHYRFETTLVLVNVPPAARRGTGPRDRGERVDSHVVFKRQVLGGRAPQKRVVCKLDY